MLGLPLVALLTTGLLASACSNGSDSSSATTTSPRPIPDRSIPAGCAWAVRADKATANLAYPDTSATYWATAFTLGRGEELVVSGRLPAARYSSFIAYDDQGDPTSVRTDRAIARSGGTYRTGFRRTGNGAGTLIYRVYLPRPASDPLGGRPLPRLQVRNSDGTARTIATCADPGRSARATELVRTNGPATDRPAPATPVFIRPDDNGAGLYPNPDNVYVATIVHHVPGRVVVVRGKAPTFPDTGAGARVTGREQVRYWSVCTNEYRKPYPVTACIADQDVPLDADGRFTIVISTPADRPSNATTADGIAWLPWGSTEVDSLVLVRQMLAAPTFTEAATRLAPGALAVSGMGAYAPTGTQCDRATFEKAGPAGCR